MRDWYISEFSVRFEVATLVKYLSVGIAKTSTLENEDSELWKDDWCYWNN